MFKIFKKYPKLVVEVSERSDGSMKIFQDESEDQSIWKNRRKFLKKNGISVPDSVGVVLCHGKYVALAGEKDKGKLFESTDGIITKEKDVFLTVTVADCLPIFLFDPEGEVGALVHAGWKGLESGIISEAILKMKSAVVFPENILVGIGPAIGKCHYEVGEDVAEKFSKYGSEVRRQENGKIFLDIKRIAELQLIENGILAENIEVSGECTFCEKEKYFSFRRDAGGDTKKLEAMMAVIGIRN